jgi:hypothetical protein
MSIAGRPDLKVPAEKSQFQFRPGGRCVAHTPIRIVGFEFSELNRD